MEKRLYSKCTQFTVCSFRLFRNTQRRLKLQTACSFSASIGACFFHVVRREVDLERLKAIRPFLFSCQENLSALPQFGLINQLCQLVGFPAWKLPCQITLKRKKKGVFSGCPASFYCIISLSDPCFVLNQRILQRAFHLEQEWQK